MRPHGQRAGAGASRRRRHSLRQPPTPPGCPFSAQLALGVQALGKHALQLGFGQHQLVGGLLPLDHNHCCALGALQVREIQARHESLAKLLGGRCAATHLCRAICSIAWHAGTEAWRLEAGGRHSSERTVVAWWRGKTGRCAPPPACVSVAHARSQQSPCFCSRALAEPSPSQSVTMLDI